MDLDLRSISEDEFDEFGRTVQGAFGYHPTPGATEHYRRISEIDRLFAAFDDGELVATAGAASFQLTLPGATTVAAAGVTAVGVRATHRRRGLLRRMMDHQLDDVAARGEPLAILTASESAIYGRFGYGVASFETAWSLSTEGTELVRPPAADGRIRLLTAELARGVLPTVYDAAAARAPGAVTRSPAWWDVFIADVEHLRPDGAKPRFYAVFESPAGEPLGSVAWRRKDGPPRALHVDELFAVDDEVEAALFQFVLDVDLVDVVTASRRPVDERLRWRLADPRRLETTLFQDDLYVRIVDPVGALSARRYSTDDEVVLELVDPFRPGNEGRWLIAGGPVGATCARTRRRPDLTLGVSELGSLFLGGVAATVLARAGRVEPHRPDALRRADVFFTTSPAPWLTTGF